MENNGPGYAQDVNCKILMDDEVETLRNETFLGNLAVGTIVVDIPVLIRKAVDSLLLELSWGEIFAQLTAKTSGDRVGSACIWGQRRVGKTSIPKTLKTRISDDPQDSLIAVFVEAREYVHPNAARTIEQLGAKLCRQIRAADKRLQSLQQPHFDGALSAISDFFADAIEIAPGMRLLIILDEFDLVPVEL